MNDEPKMVPVPTNHPARVREWARHLFFEEQDSDKYPKALAFYGLVVSEALAAGMEYDTIRSITQEEHHKIFQR